MPQKKRRREARIIEAASLLFARHGYGETSIENIAVHADVAVGTVYNYFQNKATLLMHVLMEGHPEALEASAALLENPPADPVEAMSRLIVTQMHGTIRHDKSLWRVIHATAALEPEAFGHAYFLRKEEFTEHITRMLTILQTRGDLRDDIHISIASKTIKFVASEVFRRFASDEYLTFEEAEHDLRSMIAFIMSKVLSGVSVER